MILAIRGEDILFFPSQSACIDLDSGIAVISELPPQHDAATPPVHPGRPRLEVLPPDLQG